MSKKKEVEWGEDVQLDDNVTYSLELNGEAIQRVIVDVRGTEPHKSSDPAKPDLELKSGGSRRLSEDGTYLAEFDNKPEQQLTIHVNTIPPDLPDAILPLS